MPVQKHRVNRTAIGIFIIYTNHRLECKTCYCVSEYIIKMLNTSISLNWHNDDSDCH